MSSWTIESPSLHRRRHAVSRLSRTSPLREGERPVAAAALLDRAISCSLRPFMVTASHQHTEMDRQCRSGNVAQQSHS
jgi:hypothetical protein